MNSNKIVACLLSVLVVFPLRAESYVSENVVRADKFDGIVSGRGDEEPAGYMPVLVANGELAMTVDRTFGVRDSQIPQYSQGIFLEGRRVSHPRRELLPQGRW